MLKRVVVLLSMCALWTATLLVPVTDTATAAGDSATIPMATFRGLTVDRVHHRAFVSGDDEVDVLDETGQLVTRLDGLAGAAGMALSPDGGTLYVALHDGAGIEAIDTDDFARRFFATGSVGCPDQVAVAVGLVWFTQDCNDGRSYPFRALDPSSGDVFETEGDFAPQRLVSSPSRPTELIGVWSSAVSHIAVHGGASPGWTLLHEENLSGTTTQDAALTPDGGHVVVGASSGFEKYAVSSFHREDSYPAEGASDAAVAIGGDGTVAISSSDRRDGLAEVFVYAPGQTVVAEHHSLLPGWEEQGANELAPGGLAFDGSTILALTRDHARTKVQLHVFEPDPPTRPTLGGHHVALPGFSQIVADPEHHRAFVSGGTGANGVFVLDGGGRVVHVLQHLPGAAGMALDPTRDRLYVALYDGDDIAVVNTRTLRVSKRPVGHFACPNSVAFSAGLVWFTRTCIDDVGDGASLASLDPDTGAVHLHVLSMIEQLLVSSPVHPRTLYTSDLFAAVGGTATQVHVTGGARPAARRTHVIGVGPANADLSVTPDGLHTLLAPPSLERHAVTSSHGLGLDGWIDSDYQPDAVAVRQDGLTAAGVGRVDIVNQIPIGYPPYDIFLRRTATGASAGGDKFGKHLRKNLAPRGRAFGNRSLYAAVTRYHGPDPVGYDIRVIAMPPVRPLTLSADRTSYRDDPRATLVAHLIPAASRRRPLVRVYAQHTRHGARRLVARARPDRQGNVTFTRALRNRITFVATTTVGGHHLRASMRRG